MTRHTPGPWIINRRKTTIEIEVSPGTRPAHPKSTFVATVGPCGANPHNPEAEANAALITAAPDLVEALKDAIHDLAILRDGIGTDIEPFVTRLRDNLQAALRKAGAL